MLAKFESILRNTRLTPVSWLTGISGILMVRFFLEALSSPSSSGIIASDASTLVHYYLFFISFALGAMIFFHFALPSWRSLVPQFVLYLFVAVLLAPILDLVWSGGAGLSMAYIFYKPVELLQAFLQFFGPTNGITLGIRIEVAVILLFSAWLTYKVKRNIWRGVSSAVILYIAIFLFVSMPSIISLIFSFGADPLQFLGNSIAKSATFSDNLHGTLVYGYPARALEIGFNFLIGKIWFILLTLLASIWFYITDKAKALAVLKNSRPERVAFHLIGICLGLGLASVVSPPTLFSWNDYFSILTLFLSFYFSWMFAVCTNDIADEDIDKISNSSRPLIRGVLSIADLKQISIIFLIASLLGGFLAGYYAFFCILSFTSLYYIYSNPPTRFKRIPFFSSFLIGLCVLSETLAGFFLISNSKAVSTFPDKAIFGLVFIAFLWAHIRDMKDISGDAEEGIDTVPVLFNRLWGPGAGAKVVGILSSSAYLLIPVFTGIHFLWVLSIPTAFVNYYFINRCPYREFPIFLIYFVYLALAMSVISILFI